MPLLSSHSGLHSALSLPGTTNGPQAPQRTTFLLSSTARPIKDYCSLETILTNRTIPVAFSVANAREPSICLFETMNQDAPPPSIPIAAELSSLLASFQTVSQELFASVSNPKKSQTHLDNLHSLDAQLASLLNTLPRHRKNQAQIEKLVGEIREHDREWKDGVVAGEKVRRELWGLIEDGKRESERMGTGESESSCSTYVPILRLSPDLLFLLLDCYRRLNQDARLYYVVCVQ